ncbi:3-oxoacyl-ACP reductase [Sulfolobus sp. F1]|nr:3-oxoacyl-ACP reductase [Sulfolobus sp. F1]
MDYKDLFSVKGMNAVVIGAASGIGRSISEMFVSLGGKVIASDVNEEELNKLINELSSKGYEIKGIKADITKVEDVRDKLLPFILSNFKKIDALFITPAINARKSIENYTYEEFDRVINVNLKGPFIVLKEFLKFMKDGGSVVLFSSIRSIVVEPGQSAYSASKAGIVQLAKVAAAEYGKYNIRVNLIAPGVVDTPFTKQIKSKPDWYKAYAEKTIFKRWATPEEIASVAIFLVMPASSYITGTVIFVDGGWTAIDGRYEPEV